MTTTFPRSICPRPVDRIAYGETVYYPLLNSASVNGSREEIAVAEALLAERKAALQQAQTKYDEAVENAADKSAVLKAAESLAEEGDFVLLNARAESQAADRLTAERLKVLTAAQSAFQKADESLAGLTAADFRYVHESDAVTASRSRPNGTTAASMSERWKSRRKRPPAYPSIRNTSILWLSASRKATRWMSTI